MLSVLSFGETLIDMLPVNEGEYRPHAGGAPANVAVAIAKLNGNSYLLTGLSLDNLGQFLYQELLKNNVKPDFLVRKPEKTAIVLVSLDAEGERSFEFYRDNTADLNLTEQDILNVDYNNADILHLCSNTLTSDELTVNTQTVIRKAQQQNALISFDVNLRENLWQPDDLTSNVAFARINRLLEVAHIIKLSKEELQWLAKAQATSEHDYLEQLRQYNDKLILVTDGGEPVRIFSKQWQVQVQPPVTTVADTTGGGDSFIGAFLYKLSLHTSKSECVAILQDKDVIRTYVEFASACGAYTVTQKGAFNALPTHSNLVP